MDFSLFIPNLIKIWSKYWHLFLLEGLKNTLILTCISVSLGTIFGAVVALMRMSKSVILRFFASLYIEIIRGTPILLQLFIFYFVLPSLLPFLKLSPFLWVSFALCVNSAAREYKPDGITETLRTLDFIDQGQNVCILGPSDIGKSYLSKALGILACSRFSVEYHHCEPLVYSAPHCQDTKIKIIRMLPLSEQFIFSSLFISGS